MISFINSPYMSLKGLVTNYISLVDALKGVPVLCIVSTVATDVLVLKHQAISILNVD